MLFQNTPFKKMHFIYFPFHIRFITFRYKLGIIKIIRFLIRQVDLDFQASFLNFKFLN